MSNVKVRKQRHLRQGISANPFPTTEEIVRQVATGVVTGLAERVITKAMDRLAAFGKNSRAGARVNVPVREVSTDSKSMTESKIASTIATPPKAKAKAKSKSKSKAKK